MCPGSIKRILVYGSIILWNHINGNHITSATSIHIYNLQRLQKLIYMYLFTDCFMTISLQRTGERIGEKSKGLVRNLHETVCIL